MLGFSELGREARLSAPQAGFGRSLACCPLLPSQRPGGLESTHGGGGLRAFLPRGNQDGYDTSLHSQLPKSFSLQFLSFWFNFNAMPWEKGKVSVFHSAVFNQKTLRTF